MPQQLVRDVRFGMRMMARSPGFTGVALITMALGIGANTAIFSLVNGVLLKPLPYPEADRIVYLRENNLPRGWTSFSIAPLNFWDWQEQNRSLELIAAFRRTTVTYTGGDRPESLSAHLVSQDYLKILGGEPVQGRGITVEDLDPGREGVILLDHGFWEQSFGGDPDVLGRRMVLDGVPRTIIGVLPEGWRPLNRSGTDVILPLRPAPWWQEARGSHFLRGIARLKPGTTVEQAQADLSSVAAALEAEYPATNAGWGASVTPLDDVILGQARPQLLILLASVGLVLLIACANVANMTLARASDRGREIAIRTALGAGRARVVRQLLAESILLSLLGGVLGVFLAFVSLEVVFARWPEILPRMQEIDINGTVLFFTAGVSLVSGLLFGLFPALSVVGSNLAEALRKSTWSIAGHSSRRLQAGLVVAEVSLAVVLLVGSGLLIRSLLALQNENPGFEMHNRLALSTPLPESKYATREEALAYGDATLERLAAIAGVETVAITTMIPVSGRDEIWSLEVEGRPPGGPDEEISVLLYRVSADYFETMGIPVRVGREFTPNDREGSVRVAVVSESFARQHLPGEDPVGKRIRFGGEGNPFVEIVGVVGEVQHYHLGRTSMAQVYLPFPQRPDHDVSFVIKASVPPLSLVRVVRTAIQALDPDQPLVGVQTMEQIIAFDTSGPRFRTTLLTSFGLTALLLAVVGLYGVMSYTVAQRSKEIGVRMALGAQQHTILRLILRDGVPLVVTGAVVGLAGAFVLTRLLGSMLFGVGVRDPGVFATVPLLLVAVATVAMLIPARRATRVDPVKTLAPE